MMLPGTSFSTVASLPGQKPVEIHLSEFSFQRSSVFFLPCGKHRGAKTGYIIRQLINALQVIFKNSLIKYTTHSSYNTKTYITSSQTSINCHR